jgi:hypothetical protein
MCDNDIYFQKLLLARQHLKLMELSLMPFGKQVI